MLLSSITQEVAHHQCFLPGSGDTFKEYFTWKLSSYPEIQSGPRKLLLPSL